MKAVKEATIVVLSLLGIGFVFALILTDSAGFHHFMGELHDAFWTVFWGLVKIGTIILVIGIAYWVAYGAIVLRRERNVIRPNRHGRAQAVLRKGLDPFLLPQEGESSHHDLELSRLVYQVGQEREKLLAQQYKALEAQHRYEQRALPPPSTQVSPQVEVPGNPEERITLSSQFGMHVNEMLSNRGFFVGTSGSGKSESVAVVTEELFRLEVPLIHFDSEGEYVRLPQFMGRGMTVDSTQLSAANAEQFGRYVIANHQQVVVNLLSYDDIDEAALVMVNALTGITKWEEERHNEVRVAIMTFLTEAHKWFPQYMQESQLSMNVYIQMQAAFFTSLVRRGRKRGMGLIFDTQKLAEVDKRLMQPDWKVCLRQTEARPLKQYKEWGIEPSEATSLKNGEGFIYSSRVTKLRTRMNRRKSPDDSKSLGIESVRNHQPEADEIWTPNSLSPWGDTTRPERASLSTVEIGGERESADERPRETRREMTESLSQTERVSPKKVEVTREERAAIQAAARAQLAASGKAKVARQRLIDDQPGWYNKKWWDKVAYVLNEEGL